MILVVWQDIIAARGYWWKSTWEQDRRVVLARGLDLQLSVQCSLHPFDMHTLA
jgi:hypothetical protein